MSEVKLNLIDTQQILHGTIHGSIADACVAALSAEPETIAELETALSRFVTRAPSTLETGKSRDNFREFASFHSSPEIDTEPWDAGIMIIDLAARVVAAESTYSQPTHEGKVVFHDDTQSDRVAVHYRVADEWLFLTTVGEYESRHLDRARERAARRSFDARRVLYGHELLEFIIRNVQESSICREEMNSPTSLASVCRADESFTAVEEEAAAVLAAEIIAIHARWLMTGRDHLEGKSPRDVLLAKQEFIDFDLQMRELQWSFLGEGPPCLAQDSFAYRFAGFGTHENVVYYDLVRHLLWRALDCQPFQVTTESADFAAEIARLKQIAADWLETPQDSCRWTPANIIDNERRRLPLALTAKEMIIDEDCEICVMSAHEVAMGYGPGFQHLDGSHMEDDFVFSFYQTRAEWEEENNRREIFSREFNQRWEERQQRIARGEPVEDEFNLDWVDSLDAKAAMPPASEAVDESDKPVS